MAIFRAETKHISRSKNHNVVAAAAYRAGEKLTDKNKFNPDAKTHDYSKKTGVVSSGIILPKNLAGKVNIDRQTLWSSVEESETTTRSVKGSRLKQKARLAREWLLALPHELTDEENEELTREFTQTLVNELGVIADYAIHKPTSSKPKKDYIEFYDVETRKVEKQEVYDIEPSQPDPRNVHAHILFTTRKTELNDDGSLKFGDKADSERSEKWRKEQGLVNGGDYIKQIRQKWAEMVNKRLESRNIATVSHESYREQGLSIKPQVKRGKNANALSLYGTKTRIDEHNEQIKKYNEFLAQSYTDTSIKTSYYDAEYDDEDMLSDYIELTKSIDNVKTNSNEQKKPSNSILSLSERLKALKDKSGTNANTRVIKASEEKTEEETEEKTNENQYRPRPRF